MSLGSWSPHERRWLDCNTRVPARMTVAVVSRGGGLTCVEVLCSTAGLLIGGGLLQP